MLGLLRWRLESGDREQPKRPSGAVAAICQLLKGALGSLFRKTVGMESPGDAEPWQGIVQNHHQSGSSPARRPPCRMMGEAAKDCISRRFDPLRQMMDRRGENLQISRKIRPSPPILLAGGGGWFCEIPSDGRAFWPSANGLPWRKAPCHREYFANAPRNLAKWQLITA